MFGGMWDVKCQKDPSVISRGGVDGSKNLHRLASLLSERLAIWSQVPYLVPDSIFGQTEKTGQPGSWVHCRFQLI